MCVGGTAAPLIQGEEYRCVLLTLLCTGGAAEVSPHGAATAGSQSSMLVSGAHVVVIKDIKLGPVILGICGAI